MHFAPAALSLAVLLGAATARAEEDPAAVWDRSFLIGARIDLLPLPNPSGFVVIEVAPFRFASFEIGGGAGALQRPVALAMLHLRWPLGRYAPGIEGGFVTGPFEWDPGLKTFGVGFESHSDEIGYGFTERSDALVFGRLGGAFSMRLKGGPLHVSVHAGVSLLLNRESAYCDPERGSAGTCTLAGMPTALPYAGTAVGYAFDL